MMRKQFQGQLQVIREQVLEMGEDCQKALKLASGSIASGSREKAKETMALLTVIGHERRRCEDLCQRILLLQQPIAQDLRFVSSAMKMAEDLDRIGTQAADIAEIVTMANLHSGSVTDVIGSMSEAALKMLSEAMRAFADQDTVLAESVIRYDDVVDDCFDKAKRALLCMAAGGEADGQYIIDLLMIAKYLERIGDHAVNIGSSVIYAAAGKRVTEV